jgi:tetratricopeptide (TPR) repeat protein
MRILHLNLKLAKEEYAELRYFFENPNDFESRSLPLKDIAELIQMTEQDYYVHLAENYSITGQKLYRWLDGSDRWLSRALAQCPGEGVALAISSTEKLAYLPWEILHDGSRFLIKRLPAVVPIRWVVLESVSKVSVITEPANRALRTLFMATSPTGMEPELFFEEEERRILKAKERQPRELELVVEESGCLSELRHLVVNYGREYFDIFHLTGHATLTDEGAYFITETETGGAYSASANDISRELQFLYPKIVFLSGCRTGQADVSRAIPSIAEQLLTLGARAVLGWGQKVLDTDAATAAAVFYEALSEGYEVTEALGLAYQKLLENEARDWHLLRLYVSDRLPGQIVKPRNSPGWKPAPPPSVSTQFLDSAGIVKVPKRESFVGRRRQLQRCLQALIQQPDTTGILIHGMGGCGKSSLAARLCDRLQNFERLVWVGSIDEPEVVKRLAGKLDSDSQRKALLNAQEPLKFRLRRLFQHSVDGAEKPLLLVLDDFEHNLEPRSQTWTLKMGAANILQAIVWAIRETEASHRLILTCRYDFESSQLRYFYKQPLNSLQGSDLKKKCERLATFMSESKLPPALQFQAKKLADGNPKLLELLDQRLQEPNIDQVAILNQLENDSKELRIEVLEDALLEQIDQPLLDMLSCASVFGLPVPKDAIAAVCEAAFEQLSELIAETIHQGNQSSPELVAEFFNRIGIWMSPQVSPDLEQIIDQAVGLGLLEVNPDGWLRMPQIIPMHLSEDVEESLCKNAALSLRYLWRGGSWKGVSWVYEEDQILEIHRLSLKGNLTWLAAHIAWVVSNDWFRRQSRFRESIQLCNSTLAIVRDYRVLHQLARSQEKLGLIDQAQINYQQALESCPEEDIPEKSAIINNLAVLKVRQGSIRDAVPLFEKALKMVEGTGNLEWKACVLHSIADAKARSGQIEEAISLFQQTLEIDKITQNFVDTHSTLGQIGSIYADLGQFEEAVSFYQQALKVASNTNNIDAIATILNDIGTIRSAEERFDEALLLYQESLELSKSIGDERSNARTLVNIADLYIRKEEFDKAIDLYQESREISKRINDIRMLAIASNKLGNLKASLLKFPEALEYCLEALKLFEQQDESEEKAFALRTLGHISLTLNKFEAAENYFKRSLKIFQDLRVSAGELALEQDLFRLPFLKEMCEALQREKEKGCLNARKIKDIMMEYRAP